MIILVRHADNLPTAGGFDAGFVYFGEADEAGHAYGGLSPECRAAVRRIDDHLRSLVEAIIGRASSVGEDWVLAVTTDHGHLDEGGYGAGSEPETTSFALACCYGPNVQNQGTGPKDWPDQMPPTELTPRLVDLAQR